MSKDTNRVLDHADESDGIDEYDNPLPDWWLGLLWLTIVWAIGYGVHYHFIAQKSQVSVLAAEMAAADERWPVQARAQTVGAFVISADAVAGGEAIYAQNCLPCHGASLEGGIGPSFVDAEWVHGGTATDVLTTIREGVPAKGMVPWGGILSPDQINQVAAYVLQKHMDATGRALEDVMAVPGDVEGQ